MTADEDRAGRPTLKPAPEVVVEKIEDASILINLQTNRMFELNSTGTRLWELLVEGNDVGAIKAQLLREYDVDQPTVGSEVDDLLARLEAEHLIVEESP